MRRALLALVLTTAACADLTEALKPEGARRVEQEIRQQMAGALEGCARGDFKSYRFDVDEASRRMPELLGEQYPFHAAAGAATELVRAAVARCDGQFAAFEKHKEDVRQQEIAAERAEFDKLVGSVTGDRRSILQMRGHPSRWPRGEQVAQASFWVYDLPSDGTRPGACTLTYLFHGNAIASTEAEPAWCAAQSSR